MKIINVTGNKVLLDIEKEVKEETTETGILLTPSSTKRDMIEATALAIGKDVKEVQVGDRVICEEQIIKTFLFEGDEYSVIPEASVLGFRASNEKLQPINEDKDN